MTDVLFNENSEPDMDQEYANLCQVLECSKVIIDAVFAHPRAYTKEERMTALRNLISAINKAEGKNRS